MAEFLVKMADERGHVLQQVESGISEQEIRNRFAQQGFLVYSVKSRRGVLPMGGGLRKKSLKADQFVIFNHQFLTLIKAGLPILKSLSVLTKRQKNRSFKSMLENIQERVKSAEFNLQDLHHDPAGGRTKRKSGRGPGTLYRVSAHQRLIPQEADLFTLVSRATDHCSHRHADVPDDLRCTPVCRSL